MKVADLLEDVLGPESPIGVRAYDGSSFHPDGAMATVHVKSPKAARYLLFAPGELGMARAFVSGEIDVEGGLYDALRAGETLADVDVTWADRLGALRALGLHAIGNTSPPPEEVRISRLAGRRHSKLRDAKAISHHYDVSNDFYEIVLGPTMAYTCAVYPSEDATLEEAQTEKFDLVCRKLDLHPGMRLLDVGCGWGGVVMHAARHFGVQALGVTLSRQQAEWAQRRIRQAGLSDRAQVRFQDYRDVAEDPFDAISSIGLTEHIGADQLPNYFRHLRGLLKPQGRLLNHAIMRPATARAKMHPRTFINRYVFPDGELEEVGAVITVMNDTGFEVQHEENLRAHYAKTLAAWCANLDAGWDAAVELVGEGRARVWALYMAGSRLIFEKNRMHLHQVLATRTEAGRSGMPLRPDWQARGTRVLDDVAMGSTS